MKEDRLGEALKELDACLAAVPNPPGREKLLAIQSQLRAEINKSIAAPNSPDRNAV